VKNLNVKKIYVSPLRRALRTSVEVFKEQENTPQYVAEPRLREGMCSSCDIPSNVLQSRELFSFIDFGFLDQEGYTHPEVEWFMKQLNMERVDNALRPKLKEGDAAHNVD